MAARLPLLRKTPFVLDGRPLHEATSPHAGALSISRAYRALGVPQLIEANLALRKRQRPTGLCGAARDGDAAIFSSLRGEYV